MEVLIHVVSNPIREKTAGLVKISGTHPNDLESYFTLPAFYYRTRAIIGRSRFEAALVYKPRILSLKNEEFPFLIHKLSAI